jgi:hypothetical protein
VIHQRSNTFITCENRKISATCRSCGVAVFGPVGVGFIMDERHGPCIIIAVTNGDEAHDVCVIPMAKFPGMRVLTESMDVPPGSMIQ